MTGRLEEITKEVVERSADVTPAARRRRPSVCLRSCTRGLVVRVLQSSLVVAAVHPTIADGGDGRCERRVYQINGGSRESAAAAHLLQPVGLTCQYPRGRWLGSWHQRPTSLRQVLSRVLQPSSYSLRGAEQHHCRFPPTIQMAKRGAVRRRRLVSLSPTTARTDISRTSVAIRLSRGMGGGPRHGKANARKI